MKTTKRTLHNVLFVQYDVLWSKYSPVSATLIRICLSLFGWRENILHKQHIVQWSVRSIGSGKIEIRSQFVNCSSSCQLDFPSFTPAR